MSFFDSFLNPGAKQAKQGYSAATGMLKGGEAKARGELTTGFDSADNYLSRIGSGLDAGYTEAGAALDAGQREAQGYLDPYTTAGSDANTMYRNALGMNGTAAQQGFGQNFAASDPFRAQNADFATEAIMRAMNARGMSGSGAAAEAVARQNLMRGSQDYENYLNRLSGVRDSGQTAATNMASMAGQFAGQRANVRTGLADAKTRAYGAQAENATNRGNALSNLSYGNAQQMAGQRIGLGNALAESKSAGINNLLGVAGMGLKASGWGGFGSVR